MILDTSVIIDLLRGDQRTMKKIKELEEQNISFATTTITVFELWEGKDAEDPKKREKMEEFLATLTIIPLNTDAAREAGVIQRELKREGRMIDPEDCMIAGIVRTEKEQILTGNRKHFERIRNLVVTSY